MARFSFSTPALQLGDGGSIALWEICDPPHSLPPHLLVSHLEAAAIPRKCTNKMQKYKIRHHPALTGRLHAGGRGAHQGHVEHRI